MEATEETIVPKFRKSGLRTVGGVAFGVTPPNYEVFRSQFRR